MSKFIFVLAIIIAFAAAGMSVEKERFLRGKGVNMNRLHTNAKRASLNVQHTHRNEMLDQANLFIAGQEINYKAQEKFLYGLLDGLAEQGTNACKDGLALLIWSVYEAIEYRDAYIPRNTMKFTMALSKLNEATNTIYAFCNFDHYAQIVAGLGSFESFKPHSRLIGRLAGGFISELRILLDKINNARATEEWDLVGESVGSFVSIVLDSKL